MNQEGILAQISIRLWLRLGNWLRSKNLSGLAETCYRNSAEYQDRVAAEAAFQLSQMLLASHRNREAVRACIHALRRDPGQGRIWCALGASFRRLARMSCARKAYERSLALDPRHAQAWSNLGEWWLAKGHAASALGKIEEALRLNSRLVEAQNNRIAALYELGRFDDAEAAAKAAIHDHPGVAALHVNMGNVLLHHGKARPAVKAFRRALECDPSCAEAHFNLATLFGETGHLVRALEFIEHEIAAKGESIQRLASLALARKVQGNIPVAEAICQKVLEMQPENVSALITLASCLSVRADHRGAIELHEQALKANPDMPAIQSNIAFDATYISGISAEDLFEYHSRWAARFERPVAERALTHMQTRETERPLRIGYVSGDFGRHPVGFLLKDVVQHHNKDTFHVHCYSMMRQSDEITEAIRERADSWVDALLLSDDELAEQINQDRIDILVDLSGHTAYNRLPAFARKPAPVQATWIGYFHSTGLGNIDYFITDPFTTPAGSGQLFSETPVSLPHTRFCYSPPDYAPEVGLPPSIAAGNVTFGSFNRLEKLGNPVIAAWARILSLTPGSRLLLKAGGLENDDIRNDLSGRFGAYGIGRERLELRGTSFHPEMLQQYSEIDIALDPFPFNGGMTTLETLWMGVPVITMRGGNIVSRQTFSALSNIGLSDELAFADIKGYVEGAVALACTPERITSLRRSIRPLMAASPLLDAAQFCRDLEALYRRMWQAWCKGEKLPSDI